MYHTFPVVPSLQYLLGMLAHNSPNVSDWPYVSWTRISKPAKYSKTSFESVDPRQRNAVCGLNPRYSLYLYKNEMAGKR